MFQTTLQTNNFRRLSILLISLFQMYCMKDSSLLKIVWYYLLRSIHIINSWPNEVEDDIVTHVNYFCTTVSDAYLLKYIFSIKSWSLSGPIRQKLYSDFQLQIHEWDHDIIQLVAVYNIYITIHIEDVSSLNIVRHQFRFDSVDVKCEDISSLMNNSNCSRVNIEWMLPLVNHLNLIILSYAMIVDILFSLRFTFSSIISQSIWVSLLMTYSSTMSILLFR